jgi:hypothetical protein
MEKSLSSKFEIDSHMLSETHKSSRCGFCGEKFETPLLAVVSSGYIMEEYYACPKCLSKVGDLESYKTEVDEADEEEEKPLDMEVENTMEETGACGHYLGYLKKRPKGTPIPEECLTCAKMIDCMSY